MNENAFRLTDEQSDYLRILALKFGMTFDEILVTAAFAYLDGVCFDPEFETYFRDDRRLYILEGVVPSGLS